VIDEEGADRGSFPLPHILEPGEVVETHATAQDVVIAVTSHRLIVADDDRTVIDVPFSELRRIQFDIERGRPAALVIVPEHIRDEPRVLSVQVAELREAARALALIGERLNPDAVEQRTG
jgi:hypothetical protein